MTIGFTATLGDLLHAGHCAFFQQCKKHCDVLIVALQVSPHDRPEKNTPVQSMYERWKQLESCGYVNKIIPYDDEEDLELILSIEDMDVRFLGSDYVDKDFTGKSICDNRGIKIIYIPRRHLLSTSELRRRVFLEESTK